jgi:quercetin dioxygenase-like cupin family protein
VSTKYTDVEVGGNLVDLLLGGRDTGGRAALISSVERSGCEPPLHRHRNEDEIVYVLAGELTFYVAGEPRSLLSGECLLLPRGVEHGYRVESDEARLLTVVMPAGLEGYYLELGAYGRPADIERLVTVAAHYGVEITGPPPAGEPWPGGGAARHVLAK